VWPQARHVPPCLAWNLLTFKIWLFERV
jgi:hypothetical protein